jgi:type IV secretory pathway TraG/TraD family ATPase VirD4
VGGASGAYGSARDGVLPQLVTDGAGQGITTMIVLQSLGQARARWGIDGTAALWDGCTVKLVLGQTFWSSGEPVS